MESSAGDRAPKKSFTHQLEDQARLARELGVSLRRLYGWEPETVTTYEYDESGRLVRSITTTEPEWNDEQVGYLIASRKWEEDTGPEGFSLEIATDPANKYKFKVPSQPTRKNYAAAAISKGQKAYYAKYDTDPKNPIDRTGDMWGTELLP